METLKIMTVSLSSPKRFKAMAAYNGEQLIITQVQPITGLFLSWRAPLVREIRAAKEQGFVVLVEERTDYIARHATQYLLEELDESTGRTHFTECLDWYFALANTDNLLFHPDVQQFAIRGGAEGSKVEKTQDDKGRPIYTVDWNAFHGGYRAVLLCIAAAQDQPLTESYFDEFVSAYFDHKTGGCDGDPVSNLRQSLLHVDTYRQQALEETRSRLPR